MVYLFHFNQRISHNHTTQHYIGFGETYARIAVQRKGGPNAARLLQVARERGIGFQVVRIWQDGDRTLERQLKNRKNAKRLCPICAALAKLNAELDAITLDNVEPLEF